MDQNISSLENTYLEDLEVETENCCHAMVKSKSIKNASSLNTLSYHVLKPPSKNKSTKNLNNKSFRLANKSLNIPVLIIKTSDIDPEKKLKIRKMISLGQPSSTQQSPLKRLLVTEKCLDYKNKKILEHNQATQKQSETMLFLTPKKQESISTSRDTSREELLNQSTRILQKESRKLEEEDFLRENQQYPGLPIYEKRNPPVYLKVSKSKKTLEHLYEQQLGRKIQIVQSQHSEADLYSVVEDHDWKLDF